MKTAEDFDYDNPIIVTTSLFNKRGVEKDYFIGIIDDTIIDNTDYFFHKMGKRDCCHSFLKKGQH